jgi:N-acetylmuramoyl-L-alanine amidase
MNKSIALAVILVLIFSGVLPVLITNATSESVTINSDRTNIREGPGLDYQKIGQAQEGETFPLIRTNGEWVQIQFQDNKKGWVAKWLVTIGRQEKKESKLRRTGTVTASALNVRSRGSLDGKVVAKVYEGETYPIVEERNHWAKIEYKKGAYGWVAAWYLDRQGLESGSFAENGTIEILYDGTNLRKRPSVQSEVVQRANKGDVFQTSELTNGWYKVRLGNGETAYVAGWIVETKDKAQQVERPAGEENLKNKTIVIDPGHGGKDRGTSGFAGTYEKNVTMQTALLVSSKLKTAGANVILTRTKDTYMPLRSRVRLAHTYGADAFISIHYDSSTEKTVKGATTFYYHPFQKRLAAILHQSIMQKTGLKDRGVKRGDYHVLRENKQYAVLVELGYLTNPKEEQLITSRQFQEKAANGIYQGLVRFFNE